MYNVEKQAVDISVLVVLVAPVGLVVARAQTSGFEVQRGVKRTCCRLLEICKTVLTVQMLLYLECRVRNFDRTVVCL